MRTIRGFALPMLALSLGVFERNAIGHSVEPERPIDPSPFILDALKRAEEAGKTSPEDLYKKIIELASVEAEKQGRRLDPLTVLVAGNDSAQGGDMDVDSAGKLKNMDFRIVTLLRGIGGRDITLTLSARPPKPGEDPNERRQAFLEVADYDPGKPPILPGTGRPAHYLYELGQVAGKLKYGANLNPDEPGCLSCHDNSSHRFPPLAATTFLTTSDAGRKFIENYRNGLERKCAAAAKSGKPTAECSAEDLFRYLRLTALTPWPPSQNPSSYDTETFVNAQAVDVYDRFAKKMRVEPASSPVLPALTAGILGCAPLSAYLPASAAKFGPELDSRVSAERDGIVQSILDPSKSSFATEYLKRYRNERAIAAPGPQMSEIPKMGDDRWQQYLMKILGQTGIDGGTLARVASQSSDPSRASVAKFASFLLLQGVPAVSPLKPEDQSVNVAARVAAVLALRPNNSVPDKGDLSFDAQIWDPYPIAFSLIGSRLETARAAFVRETIELVPDEKTRAALKAQLPTGPWTNAQNHKKGCELLAMACAQAHLGCSAKLPGAPLNQPGPAARPADSLPPPTLDSVPKAQ